jgi:hypothetical protein
VDNPKKGARMRQELFMSRRRRRKFSDDVASLRCALTEGLDDRPVHVEIAS